MNSLSTIEPETIPYPEEKWVAAICRESYEEFVREFWGTVPGGGKLIWNWHMGLICRDLQEIAERVFRNEPAAFDEVWNVPPGTSKSTLCSILFQPWVWTRMPSARFINATHTHDLVMDFADKSLQVMQSEKYKACFPEIVLRKSAVGSFANTFGGDRLGCTVGGKTPVGFHAHFLTGDDLIDPQKAMSEAELKTAREFVENDLPTRMVNKQVSVMLLIMQRLGRGDPTEVLLEIAKREGARPVRHICLPCDDSWPIHPPELKENYIDGLLDPGRLPQVVLRAYRARGEYRYAAQFGQAPMPLGGGMFKDTYFLQRVKAAPYHAKRIRYWDRASAVNDGACFTAGVLMSRDDIGNFYVENVVHGRWEPDERNQKIRATALRDRSRYGPKNDPVIWIEREGGSSGRDAWKGVARALAGFNVREDTVTGSKDVRAEPWSSQLAANNVFLVSDGTWDIDKYVEEHCLFRPEPGKRLGRYVDMVDASSGAFNLLIGSKQIGSMRILRSGPSKQLLRIAVLTRESLANELIENTALLVNLAEPDPLANGEIPPLPLHGIGKLIDSLTLRFADTSPEDHQDRWGDLIPPYDLPAEKIIMIPEQGKKLWSLLTKKRGASPELFVFVDGGDGRALSMAMAVADVMRLPRATTIYLSSNPDNKEVLEGNPPNKHVYNVTKSSRAMVL